ncbi:MAG: NRDE family protein [Cyclobacteriaceae bacterium]|nr:NRDE family protein [Cyclobacteriaceae bacterium]MCH8516795.1 NRDE family protein [Cyclobacteriaceae bacterium]
MCTLSFLPLTSSTFMIGSNRDEIVSRAKVEFPSFNSFSADRAIIYPKEEQSQGSWLAADSDGCIMCLLNGATHPHKSNPPYRLSRGKLVIQSLTDNDPVGFLNNFDYHQIESFTIVYFNTLKKEIREWVWDEHQLQSNHYTMEHPLFWSSPSLYSDDDRAAKSKRFEAVTAKILHFEDSQAFHQEEGIALSPIDTGTHGIIKTISFSGFVIKPEEVEFRYSDYESKLDHQLLYAL